MRRSVAGWSPELSVALRLGGAAALLLLTFATSWYGLSTLAHGAFGATTSGSAGAWRMLHLVRWLLLAAILMTLLSVVLRRGVVADLATALGAVTTVAVLLRLFVVVPDAHAVLDVKLGGYLALVACVVMTLGAYEAPGRVIGPAAGSVPDTGASGSTASATSGAGPRQISSSVD